MRSRRCSHDQRAFTAHALSAHFLLLKNGGIKSRAMENSSITIIQLFTSGASTQGAGRHPMPLALLRTMGIRIAVKRGIIMCGRCHVKQRLRAANRGVEHLRGVAAFLRKLDLRCVSTCFVTRSIFTCTCRGKQHLLRQKNK